MAEEPVSNEEGAALGELSWGVPFRRAHRKAPKSGGFGSIAAANGGTSRSLVG